MDADGTFFDSKDAQMRDNGVKTNEFWYQYHRFQASPYLQQIFDLQKLSQK